MRRNRMRPLPRLGANHRFFGPGKGRVAHGRVLGLGTVAKKIASGDK
jgi:hypothetical protein